MRRFTFGLQPGWLLWIAFLWACTACAQLKTTSQARNHSAEFKQARTIKTKAISNQELPFFHKVHYEGETLSLIAKWYTGDWKNWKTLAKVNPWVEPTNMFRGLKVKIPSKLLRTRNPMPRKFVLSAIAKPKDRSPAAAEDVEKDQIKDVRKVSPKKTSTKTNYMDLVVP